MRRGTATALGAWGIVSCGVVAAVALAALAAPAAAAPVAGVPAARVAALADDRSTEPERVRAAAALGILADDDLLLRSDRDFVFEIWRRSPENKPEVKAAALAAHDEGPAACTLFIRVGVYDANERDKAREIEDATAARMAREAKAAAAAVLGIVAPPEMLVLSDWDFIAEIWKHQSAGPRVKAAAVAALQGSPEDRKAFIATGVQEAHRQDVLDQIEADRQKTEAEKEALRWRDAKARAAAVIGVVASEEVLVLSDDNFIRMIWDRAKPGSEVAAAAQAALRSPDPAQWKAFIDTGIYQANQRDIDAALRQKAEEDRRLATQIKAKAENSGVHPALAAAAGAALAGSDADVDRFLRVGQYDALTQSIRTTTPGLVGWYVQSGPGDAVVAPGDPGEAPSAPVGKATWKIIAGLADPECYSLESVDHLGHYLRVDQFRVKLAPSDGSTEFKNSATWCVRKSASGVSFESKAMPGRFLRHAGEALWAANQSGQNRADRVCGFAENTTWSIDAPNPQVTQRPTPVRDQCSCDNSETSVSIMESANVTKASDFTGDCKTDITAQYKDGRLRTWASTGNLSADHKLFAGATALVGTGWTASNVERIVTGDFTGDGRTDIIGQYDGGVLRAWASRGDLSADHRNFPGPAQIVGTSWTMENVVRIITGDFTGDGKTDIIGQYNDGKLRAWASTGDLSDEKKLFRGSGTVVGTGWTAATIQRVMTGDFTGDGKTDLLAQYTGGKLRLWASTGDLSANNKLFAGASAEVGTGWAVASAPRILTGDFTGDGKTDIIKQLPDGTLKAWASTGDLSDDGKMFPGPARTVGTGWTTAAIPRIVLGDFNGDGKTDIVRQYADGLLRLWASTGDLSADGKMFRGPGVVVGGGWTTENVRRIA